MTKWKFNELFTYKNDTYNITLEKEILIEKADFKG